MPTRVSRIATSRSPPRNGGIAYVSEPGKVHFSDAPMSKLVSSGGGINMELNINHPFAILLSWERMADDIESEARRVDEQDYATNWGKMVSDVLKEIE